METFKSLQDDISKALVATTRSASTIARADIPFQRSLNPEIGSQLDAQNARLLLLAQRLLANTSSSSDGVGPKLPDVEAIDANWRGIVDVIDSLLEKADMSLDEFTGIVKRLSPPGEQAAAAKSRTHVGDKKNINIPKPQLTFQHVPNNHETQGFRPLLTSKPHSMIPLDTCLKTFKDNKDREQYPHPYQTEIQAYEYPESVYQISEPQMYHPFESTTATFVDTPEALAAMLAELKTAKEIAIDLEHHDNRSYVGIVCLMQISTRDKDWIVDTLKPWRRDLQCLNEVFTDPNIVKVLHGAYMDCIWLQRDLGLYLVGLFDTYHAARALGYPGASLAYLLDKFVNFKAQKQYQLADWRQRPLTDELFEYARADTHFLLYIYDNMRNELVSKSDFSNPEKNKVRDVLANSKDVALQRYEHPIYESDMGLGPVGWYKLIAKTPVQLTSQQFAVFKAVHEWRDTLARNEDESPLFIMPNHAVFSLARAMPIEKAPLFSAIQHVSHLVKTNADDLVKVIAQAKQIGINGPELNDVLKQIGDLREAEKAAKYDTPIKPAATPIVPIVQASSNSTTVTTPATRAPASKFWGKLWRADSPQGQQRSLSTMHVDLALPLPPLTAEIFAERNGIAETPKAEKPEHKFVPKEDRLEDQRTDMFIVKQLGGKKRKRGDAPESPAVQQPLDPMTNDEIAIDPEAEEEEQRKRDKAARRAAKKQKKRDDAAQRAAAAGQDDDTPFDYANATSVLHAEDNAGKKKDKKDKKKKKGGAFDPFRNMADAPRGLPAKHQKDVAGRSRTFTS